MQLIARTKTSMKLKYKRGRYHAYRWLSQQLQRPSEYTHIGMMDIDECQKVIELSKAFLYSKDPEKFSKYKDTSI